MKSTIRERLVQIRKALRLNQAEFGERIGVKASAVSNWEQGTQELPTARFRLICSTYNINPDWLQNGDGEMFNESTLGSNDSEIEVNAFIQSALKLLAPITQEKLLTLTKLIDQINESNEIDDSDVA